MLQNFNTLSKSYIEIEWKAKALDSSSSDAMTTASDNLETPVCSQLLTLFTGALRALDSFVPCLMEQESSVVRRCACAALAGHK